ncbi:MarR family winged helix-turn-helix transcriptional regulator [Leifsonia virtsii]|uniref:MarR family transcriptional regulator n=1 Tax=Leifsonia virtsii TaxID=3035915 RepID=A0ABT8J2F2_9MICO|nr:MarR family transcriptional regulator [Leifsonia virtsii]MDN4599262.1 MarR family transcriptional regulator [Leifsonia virtsii]
MPETPELRQIIGDLVVAAHRLARLAAQVTGSTESPATWRTLSVLQSSGPMRLGELASQSRVSQPTMTKLVRNLVDAEWVKRIADADDARAWQIAVTPKGVEALQTWRDELSAALVPMFSDLSEAEVAAMRTTVEIIGSRVDLSAAASAALAGSR